MCKTILCLLVFLREGKKLFSETNGKANTPELLYNALPQVLFSFPFHTKHQRASNITKTSSFHFWKLH